MEWYIGWFCGCIVSACYFLSLDWLRQHEDPKPAQTAFLYALGATVVIGVLSGFIRAIVG